MTRKLIALAAAAVFASAAQAKEQTIVDIAAGNPDFSTLVSAVKAAGLVDTLSSEGPFTVFAPTNEAFAKLPQGTLESLLKPENKDQLVAILTYHVVAGEVKAEQVVKLDQAKTVNGKALSIDSANGVRVNNATVTATDIEASNGVIHVLDTVVLP
ncbi:fasciclin domain-containing protein [Pseudomarimonas arenosa]|uniref:Fasciclin domain-containing protein n=1 Tax=Pseudomarimonas arenosa TaxID=2774145 RepID=A0AAW3ZNW2_9GAMM|nr:fasciclin domain-containing protein [Pseudomarimonas arenosa]MBD8526857.1 fasciclin domain-containing protein [Pseudomarimonas arenosa]